ncbi:uncharacterized protein LOC131234677 isoform X2 [Magnolia sinica]|uniref:uncharacterized protein LOC131234677 isoform X2 n=1 Tax=Magnolia sinica TaxID=86752 RepID=UPI002659C06F|nr:uncharacterized protein LOC131234677 isoform X2 [Magnolia sinica]
MLEAAAAVACFHCSFSIATFPLSKQLQLNPSNPSLSPHLSLKRRRKRSLREVRGVIASSQNLSRAGVDGVEEEAPMKKKCGNKTSDTTNIKKLGTSRRVFFLDVNPLCYVGSRPSLRSFARWISLFFSQVSLRDPVIAVLDGDEANEYRRQMLPSYKAHRRRFSKELSALQQTSRGTDGSPYSKELSALQRTSRGTDGSPYYSMPRVTDVLQKCNVPVLKIKNYEADDTIATLVDQALQRGYRVVIGSPDKDFKQLISEDVQIVMPMPEFGRWSFYTLKHYIAQYNCEPSADLSLRCLVGDEVDGVPGIQHLVPGFGRKTALKLLKKHGSLENLLQTAAIRTVGKQYAQDALTKHADYLRKNYEGC